MTQSGEPVVLITGCSTGIGRALAEESLCRAYRTVATARDPDSIADLGGDRSRALHLDVTDGGSVGRAAVLKIGGGARIVPTMAMLPKKVLAKLMGRKFGLT